MNSLPDVSRTEAAAHLGPLDWVGMAGIDLPVAVSEPDYRQVLPARVDAQVNLPAAAIKGIHMSRLYRLLETLEQELSPARLAEVVAAMIDSHRDCGTDSARLRLRFGLLVRRPALVTPELAGWKSYPVTVAVVRTGSVTTLTATVRVMYSSTCPCSAALSRQWLAEAFRGAFPGDAALDPGAVAQWLRHNGSLATPHSQRSEARVQVEVPPGAPGLGLLALIAGIEQALGTPVQTAVKRADEQAFAVLNGGNLMFVEDAARRIRRQLRGQFLQPQVRVRHLESLHPHDAVAWATEAMDGMG